jgi:hypothetical protein
LGRPLLMIMLDKRSYGRPEVPFAEWHERAFPSDRRKE